MIIIIIHFKLSINKLMAMSNECIVIFEIIIIIILSVSCGTLMNWTFVIDEYFIVREILTFICMMIVVKIIDKYL
jgi:hypothetical protein